MKFHVQLHAGSKSSHHQVEFAPDEAGATTRGPFSFTLDGVRLEAQAVELSPGILSVLVRGRPYEVSVARRVGTAPGGSNLFDVGVGHRQFQVEVRDLRRWRGARASLEAEGPQEIAAPMPGKIVRLLVAENQEVERDQGLLVIEAMKMQNELRAPRSGRVLKIYVQEGTGVEAGSKLIRLS